ncbi:MAG: hypothetical protein IRZ08_01270 [Frankia sp.]|nr:hypothetical protein [Frankia sp.]
MVIPDRGQWRVEIIVLFTDGVVRRRVGTFATRQRAEIWADLVRRAAERDIPWPPRGDGQA